MVLVTLLVSRFAKWDPQHDIVGQVPRYPPAPAVGATNDAQFRGNVRMRLVTRPKVHNTTIHYTTLQPQPSRTPRHFLRCRVP